MQPKNFQLGFFIKLRHVDKAIKLLLLQLDQTNPIYNTLDYTLYRKDNIRNYNSDKFYRDYVESDSLYYFKSLFYTQKYFAVQHAYKIREFHFLSLPSLIVYYSIGMYIGELLDKRLREEKSIFKDKGLNCFYGGRIDFENPSVSTVTYYDDYKKFISLKEKLTNPVSGKIKYVMSLDIKSFFYSIDHDLLLKAVEKLSTPSLRSQLNFTETTKDSIVSILRYFQESTLGLPVGNQNIISSFLSAIYFNSFDRHISSKYLNKEEFSYVRYVDDFYLIIEEDSEYSIEHVRSKLYDIENDISDFLINKLHLVVNSSKCDRYKIEDKESQIEFLRCSNVESFYIDEAENLEVIEDDNIGENEGLALIMDIDNDTYEEIFDKCLTILKDLKSQSLYLPHLSLKIKESAYLNNLLIHQPCLNYSKSKEGIAKVVEADLFDEINSIDFFLLKPKVLLHLCTVNPTSRSRLFTFITESLMNSQSIIPKLTLLDRFIHQIKYLISTTKQQIRQELEKEFENFCLKVVNHLSILQKTLGYDNSYLRLTLSSLGEEDKSLVFDGIYSCDFLNLEKCTAITQQIKLRRINERMKNYNVCFNHLLNEFQKLFVQTYFSNEPDKDITANDIKQEMSKQFFEPDEIDIISDFFERRNQNSISHANDSDIGFWPVTESEYHKIKSDSKPIMRRVYNVRTIQPTVVVP